MIAVAAALAVYGCSSNKASPSSDAGSSDAGLDAALPSDGGMDATVPSDGGGMDATVMDAGPSSDGGNADAASSDGGNADAASSDGGTACSGTGSYLYVVSTLGMPVDLSTAPDTFPGFNLDNSTGATCDTPTTDGGVGQVMDGQWMGMQGIDNGLATSALG